MSSTSPGIWTIIFSRSRGPDGCQDGKVGLSVRRIEICRAWPWTFAQTFIVSRGLIQTLMIPWIFHEVHIWLSWSLRQIFTIHWGRIIITSGESPRLFLQCRHQVTIQSFSNSIAISLQLYNWINVLFESFCWFSLNFRSNYLFCGTLYLSLNLTILWRTSYFVLKMYNFLHLSKVNSKEL